MIISHSSVQAVQNRGLSSFWKPLSVGMNSNRMAVLEQKIVLSYWCGTSSLDQIWQLVTYEQQLKIAYLIIEQTDGTIEKMAMMMMTTMTMIIIMKMVMIMTTTPIDAHLTAPLRFRPWAVRCCSRTARCPRSLSVLCPTPSHLQTTTWKTVKINVSQVEIIQKINWL